MSLRTCRPLRLAALLAGTLTFLVTCHVPAALAEPCEIGDEDEEVAEEIIITLWRADPDEPGRLPPDAQCAADPRGRMLAIAARHGLILDLGREILPLRLWVATAPGVPPTEMEAFASMLEADDPCIHHADPHFIFDVPEGVQRNLPDLTRTPTLTDFLEQPAAQVIGVAPAGRRFTGAGVKVAILDTRATVDYPLTRDLMAGPGLDLVTGTGTADVVANGVDDDGDGSTDEAAEHATFVAGLVHLASPEARLLHVRALDDDGRGDAVTVAKAIVEAVAAGADVINLSLGMGREQRALEEAIEYALERNVVVVAAAGNRGMPCVDFPAHFDEEEDNGKRLKAVAVGAVDDGLVKADFSGEGVEVDSSAPGVDVISTHLDVYGHWSGTSFATPMVAGAAALIRGKYPAMSAEEVRVALRDTTQPDANPPDVLLGTGVLDLGAVEAWLAADRRSLILERTPGGGTLARFSPVRDASLYDLVRGEIRNLALVGGAVDLGPLTCVADDLLETPDALDLEDGTPTPPGGFFWLFRDDAPDAEGGTYGMASDGRFRTATACP